MNFFKKFFSRKSNPASSPDPSNSIPPKKTSPTPPTPPNISNLSIQVKDEEAFNKRYRPMTSPDDVKLLEGSVKMIGSYALIAHATLPHEQTLNHPENLDFSTKNGYLNWMKSVGMADGDIAAQLCFAISDYLIKQHKMVLYHDHLPDYKFRMFTLKKMVHGIEISVYPLEFTIKVLNENRSFFGIRKNDIGSGAEVDGSRRLTIEVG